jgi:tripartite-type tricarboxylate transporter receptor subunit TctC
LLVGFTPAGGNDIIARLMGQWLTERLGQTFVSYCPGWLDGSGKT